MVLFFRSFVGLEASPSFPDYAEPVIGPATSRRAGRRQKKITPGGCWFARVVWHNSDADRGTTPSRPLRMTSQMPLPLRAEQAEIALGAEYVAVKARDPLAAARRDVEITNGGLNVRRDAVVIELWI